MSTIVATSNFQFNRFRSYEPLSHEGRLAATSWKANGNYLRSSAIYWLPLVAAALEQIRSDCQRENWDGPDSTPVSDATIASALNFARAMYQLLPISIPPPDIVPDPDGDISVDWIINQRQLFSVSVSTRGTISFAGQFGREGGDHGWRRLDPSSPAALEESLRDVAEFVKRLFAPPPNVNR
jgi:hypothetical protein